MEELVLRIRTCINDNNNGTDGPATKRGRDKADNESLAEYVILE